MKKLKNETVKTASIYELDGVVPLKKALPLGIQHILAMFLGNISPLLIVCGMLAMDNGLKTILIQNAMFVAGVATLIQLYPFWKIGSGLPIVMGTSSGFIGNRCSVRLRCLDGRKLHRRYFRDDPRLFYQAAA